jgi:hypothetical protein
MNRTWRQRNRGAVLVEFAILTPILVLLAFGIAELGRVFYQQNTLTKSVTSGARYMARSYDILDPDNCTVKPLWSTFESRAKNLVVYGAFAAEGNPLVPNLETGNVAISFRQASVSVGEDDDIDACIINVSATVLFEGIFGDGKTVPLLPFMGEGGWGGFTDVTLNAATEERYIGE